MSRTDSAEKTRRFCVDCRFAEFGISPKGVWMCTHPTSFYQAPPNLVTGVQPKQEQLECAEARLYDNRDNLCGKAGRHWEARA